MKKKCILFFSLVLLIFGLFATSTSPISSVLIGTIQFPKDLQTIPMIRIRFGGKKVPCELCEINQQDKTFAYKITRYPNQQTLYIVIAEKIDFKVATKETVSNHNTVQYLTVPSGIPYKLYALTWKPKSTLSQKEKTDPKSTHYFWEIQEYLLPPDTRKIPDDAIIINFDPTLIACLEGGSSTQLPTLVIKDNLLTLVESEEIFMETVNKLLLSSLDTDAVHSSMHPIIKTVDHHRALIAIPLIY